MLSRFSIFGGVSLSAVNQFLFLYWSAGYYERMTTSRALKICISLRILMIALTLLGYTMDPSITKCSPPSKLPICQRFSPENFYWQVPPQMIVIIVSASVTIYLTRKIILLQNSVNPVVNLPNIGTNNSFSDIQQIPSISSQVNYDAKTDDVTIFDLEENTETQVPSFRNTLSKEKETLTETKRINSDPNMFYRVARHSETVNLRTSCLLPILPVETAKKILMVNLESLSVLMLLIPRIIFHLYVHQTGNICEGNETVLMIARITGPLTTIIFNILYLIVVFRKLDKFSNQQ